MRSMAIIEMLEVEKFGLEIDGGPELASVEVLAPKCTDPSLYQRMPERHLRNRLDCGPLECSQISLPWVESIKRVMIRAEVLGPTWPANRSREHPAQRRSLYDAARDTKANPAAAK
jgi:hypothetical protein